MTLLQRRDTSRSEIASLDADFERAVQQPNVIGAEAAARQLGQLTLENALRLLDTTGSVVAIARALRIPIREGARGGGQPSGRLSALFARRAQA